MMENTKILLLDSNSLLNRAFYALPLMTTKNGEHTNACYGYLNMLLRLISEVKPTHIAAVFDVKAPTFRHKLCDFYKGTRKGMPEELVPQVALIQELLGFLNIKVLMMTGYEADDIIGTLAKRFDYETIIVSGDRDVLQLVDDSTKIYNTKRGVTDILVYDLAQLSSEGFSPGGIIEYKALAGDSSDNIPGASGIGAITAKKLIAEYQTIENIYNNLDKMKGKLLENLVNSKDNVFLSKVLATIDIQVPIPCELSDLAYSGKFSYGIVPLLQRLEIKSLLAKIKDNIEPSSDSEKLDNVSDQTSSHKLVIDEEETLAFDNFSNTDKSNASRLNTFVRQNIEIITVTDLPQLKSILDSDFEELTLIIDSDIHFYLGKNYEYLISTAYTLLDDNPTYEEIIPLFASAFNSTKIKKILFDVKSIMHKLFNFDIAIAPTYDDILLKLYLLDANKNYTTEFLVLKEYGLSTTTPASNLYALNSYLDTLLEDNGLSALYKDIELPLVDILFNMEIDGFTLDLNVLNDFKTKFSEELNTLTKEIYAVAGKSFNINSPQQVSNILFEELNLGSSNQYKKHASVSADVLKTIKHPIATLLLRYRKISKLLSTYIIGFYNIMNKTTNKVHTIFKQCLTTTGRLSSTEPNLQNIPTRYLEGKEIRQMFVPSLGNTLVTADYSQIELRLLAHFSQDPILLMAYNQGQDIHALTASKAFHKPLENVTSDDRRIAKAVNFGIIYGISAFGLAENIGIPQKEAKEFVDAYFLSYPNVKKYMDSNVTFAENNGYIRTLFGRLRYLPELKSANFNIRAFAKRAAMNMPLQGSASDIIKIAMINVAKSLKSKNLRSKLILQVHDELIIDTVLDEVDIVKKLIKEEMEGSVKLSIPLIAEVSEGANWYLC